MSYRNSCSSRGVVVARGVIQWGCSACVADTMLNQSENNPFCAEDHAGERQKTSTAKNGAARRITTSHLRIRIGTKQLPSVHQIRLWCRLLHKSTRLAAFSGGN